MKGGNLCFFPIFFGKIELLILWLQIKVISPTMYGAASFNKRGPIMSVPVALFMSIPETNLRTLSFWI